MSSLIDNSDHIPSQRSGMFFWLIAARALFLFLGHNALSGSEGKWAESAREMYQGDLLLHVPYNWRVTSVEPLFNYWLIQLFSSFRGPTELTIGIPSALAALLMLAGVKSLGERLCNKTVARLACWLMLGSYGFLFWGRHATADMTNAAITVLAAALFFSADGKLRFYHYFFFYCLCFTAVLNKGPAAFFTPLVFLLPYLLFRKRVRPYLTMAHLCGILLPAVLFAFTVYIVKTAGTEEPFTHLAGIPGSLQTTKNGILLALSAFYKTESLFEFLLNLPRLLLPWSPLFLLEAYGMCRCWKNLSLRQQGLFAGLILLLFFFALTGNHKWEDTLPLLPFAALITAGGMIHNWTPLPLENNLIKIYFYTVIVIASLGVAVLISYPVWSNMIHAEIPFYFLLFLPCGGLAVLVLMLLDGTRKPILASFSGLPRKYAASVLGFTLLSILFWSITKPAMTQFRSTKPFCTGLQQKLIGIPADSMFFWMDEIPAELLFYFDRPDPIADDSRESLEHSREKLQELLADKSGTPFVLFSKIRYFRLPKTGEIVPQKEKHLVELEMTLHELGFTAFSAEKPDHTEPLMPFGKISSPKLAIWILEIPATKKGDTK